MQSLFKVNDTNAIELEDKTKSLQFTVGGYCRFDYTRIPTY